MFENINEIFEHLAFDNEYGARVYYNVKTRNKLLIISHLQIKK